MMKQLKQIQNQKREAQKFKQIFGKNVTSELHAQKSYRYRWQAYDRLP